MSVATHFEVLKSTDGVGWVLVAVVASPTTEYYHENKSNSGIAQYFRVRAVISGVPQTALPMQSSYASVQMTTCTYSATNEDLGFEVHRSLDGISYALDGTTEQNATSWLSPNADTGIEYWFKARAVRTYPPQAALPFQSTFCVPQSIVYAYNPGKLSGKAGEVTIAGGSVIGVLGWSLDYKVGVEESTDFSAVGVETHVPTSTGWSGSFEGLKDGAPQAIGTEIALVLKESQTSTQKWLGQAIVTGVSPSTTAKGLVAYKYTFIGTGALTVPTA